MNLADQYLKEGAQLRGAGDFRGAGALGWRSPSNIALIKYWGKRPVQVPGNPSLSFTLSSSYTDTTLAFDLQGSGKLKMDFLFEGKENPGFAARVKGYLDSLAPYLPFLDRLSLKISSSNSFPHSSGIASSASAMSALALCLAGLENHLFGTLADRDAFLRKAAFLARLGSGSATRPVYGGFVLWGRTPAVAESTDEAGIPVMLPDGNPMLGIRDAILVTSAGKKKVSSSQGHGLMDGHPWAAARYAQAGTNLEMLLKAIGEQNEEEIIGIIENEALSLHALMMSSRNGYRLMNEQTWAVIDKVRQYRRSTGTFVAFTLDAGPNVHLLYQGKDRDRVLAFIREELVALCDNGYWIDDSLGQGPAALKEA